jgi:hypothetical protein
MSVALEYLNLQLSGEIRNTRAVQSSDPLENSEKLETSGEVDHYKRFTKKGYRVSTSQSLTRFPKTLFSGTLISR